MRAPRTAIVAALLVSLAASAWAQEEPEEEELGDEVEMTEDELGDEFGDEDLFSDDPLSPSGSEENPSDPRALTNEDDADEDGARDEATTTKTGYPQEVIYRPITLPAGMIEAFLGIPVQVDPFAASGLLRGSYGVTREIEVGLRYGLGTLHEDGFETGKAVAIDARYLLTDWIAAQVSVPFYLDPFALGVTLGAPFRFTLFDAISLEGGADFLSIRLKRFIPIIDNAVENETRVALDETNTTQPAVEMNFLGTVNYQIDTKSAAQLRFGFRKSFDSNDGVPSDTPVILDVGYLFANTNKLDFGARAGFARLDDGFDSFNVQIFTAVRM